MATDGGTILIKARIDLKSLEKDLDQSRSEMQKYHDEADRLFQQKENILIKLDIDKKYVEDKLQQLDLRRDFELNTKRVNGEVAPEIEQKINEKYERMKEEAVARYNKQVDLANVKIDQLNGKIKENVSNQGLVASKIEETKGKMEELNQEISQREGIQNFNDKMNGALTKARDMKDAMGQAFNTRQLNNLSKKVEGIGKSLQGITRKVIKWGLAIFGIRSAYNLVRQSVSTIVQDNEELANKLAVIKGAIASAIEPIVTRVVNLIYTLLSAINSLVTQLTGKDLFATAKKNLQKGAKSSGEIKNNLQQASFDEQNVMSDSSGGGGGGSLAGLDDINSSLLDTLEKYKEMFLKGDLGGIARALSEAIANALNGLADKIKNINWEGIGKRISDFLTNIDFSGIFVGLVRVFGEAVLGLTNLLLAIDWPTIFANLSQGLADAISKIGEYFRQIRWGDIGKMISDTFASIKWSEIGSNIITTIWDAFQGIWTLITNVDWGQIASTLSDTIHNIYTTINLLLEQTDWEQLGRDVVDVIWDFLENIDWETLGIDIILGLCNGLKAIWDIAIGILKELIDRIWALFEVNSPSKLFEELGDFLMQGLINGIQALVDFVVNIFKGIWNSITGVFNVATTWFKDTFKKAWQGVKDVFSGVGSFFGGIWDTIKSKFTNIGTKIGEAVSGAFKKVVNVALSTIENILNTPIRGINKIVDAVAVFGIHLGKLSTFSLPRLAKGGIINQPSRGVMVGSAIAGERGAEGVIPLTDSQQMAILGEAIGRYVTINANITNNMNGRVISRELQKLNNESDFAYNR